MIRDSTDTPGNSQSSLTVGTLSATQITITDAASKIIPGATSLSLRNHADSADNIIVTDAGAVTVRTTLTATTSVVSPLLDSGVAGPISLKTNNGSKHLEITHNTGTLVNYWSVSGNPTGAGPLLSATGSDANVEAFFDVKGQAHYHFRSRGGTVTQLQILDSVGPNNITITGGTNPTLGVTAGSLAITPAVVMGSTLTTIGGATFHTTSTALTDGAGASVGTITNAPAAGNPTKWIGINDNGTTRYVPAW